MWRARMLSLLQSSAVALVLFLCYVSQLLLTCYDNLMQVFDVLINILKQH